MRKSVVLIAAVLALGGCSRKERAAGGAAAPAQSKPATATSQTAAAPTGVEVGAAMPAYTAMQLDGATFDLAAQKGKVVFLNVWATWCGPCRAEIPELQKLHDKYAAKQFEVVGVSVDEGNGDDVRQFVTEQKMKYPVAHDPEGKIANLLQTSVLPTSVILDRTGKIVWKSYGQVDMNDATLNKALATALGG